VPEQTAFRLADPDSPEITVRPDLLRGPSVSVDGQLVTRRRDGARVYWPISLPDGSERRLFLTGHLTGLRAIVEGAEYPVERPLAVWQLALAIIPIGLVPFLVGVAGLLTGGIATGISFAIFRAPWPAPVLIGAWAVAVGLAIAVGYVAAPLLG
jgi:hypothetical protein